MSFAFNKAVNTPATRKLGVDFGNVIQGADPLRAPQDEDTNFLDGTYEEAMCTPPITGAFNGIRNLVQRFSGNVWIVSKAGPKVARRTMAWLDHHEFWEQTGVERYSTYFVLKREGKADVASRLNLTHFIDDREDVLDHLACEKSWHTEVVKHRYHFGKPLTPSPQTHIAMPDWSYWTIVGG